MIVQTNYGDDGMDPVCMEGSSGEPVALPRMLAIVKHRTAPARELAPLPADLRRVMDEELAAMRALEPSSGRAGLDEAAQPSGSGGGSAFCTQKFADSLAGFLNEQVRPLMLSAPPTLDSFRQDMLNIRGFQLSLSTLVVTSRLAQGEALQMARLALCCASGSVPLHACLNSACMAMILPCLPHNPLSVMPAA